MATNPSIGYLIVQLFVIPGSILLPLFFVCGSPPGWQSLAGSDTWRHFAEKS
jgi:hypothetical protein